MYFLTVNMRTVVPTGYCTLNSFKNTDVIFVAGALSHDKYITCPFQPGCYIDGFWLPLGKSPLIKIIFQKENHELMRELVG